MVPGHPLAAAYARYLRERPDPGAAKLFAEALATHGLAVEAALLSAYARRGPHLAEHPGEVPWRGARVHVGAMPPPLPRPSDLWFDVVETDLSVAVSPSAAALEFGIPPRSLAGGWRYFQAWLALAPVPGWRFDAFQAVVDAARRVGSTDPLAPITGVTFHDAWDYAYWLGKTRADAFDSEEAAWTLPADRFEAMRGPVDREWLGEHNGLYYAAPFGTTVDELHEITYDDDAGFADAGHAPDVGFRTSTPVVDGPDTREPRGITSPIRYRTRQPRTP